MNDQIVCPHCKKTIPLTKALTHNLEEEISRKFKKVNDELQEKLNHKDVELAEQKKILWQKALNIAQERVKEQSAREMEFLHRQLKEQNKKLDESREKELILLKEKSRLEEKEKELDLKLERTLAEERKKIREEAFNKALETYRLKDLEKDKQIQDLRKSLEDAQRKASQGSQQLQGEVLELELERMLKAEFPYDEFKEVPKGVRGADLLQIVRNGFGRPCGIILWESKRTKAWSDGWIIKLKEDQRLVKADVAVIISQSLPPGIRHFSLKNEIFLCSFESIIGVTMFLRSSLLKIATLKSAMVGKQDKKEILWNYLTGSEFKQRMEAVSDAYEQMKIDLDKEKKWFTLKWAKQEKSLTSIINNIMGMSGDLQSIVGKALPDIKGTNILDGDNGVKDINKLF